jgi:hypothetical protein
LTAGPPGRLLAELLDRHHDPDTDGQARNCLAHALLAQGQVRDALGELDRASRSPRLPEAERTAAHAWAGFARISLGEVTRRQRDQP